MTDFDSMPPSPPQPGHNAGELTVSELSQAIKRTLEGRFDRVRVKGEISGFKRAASGHLYLMLKDENAALKSVCWKGNAARLGIIPEDGMEVIATGRITTYGDRSEYQLVIERLELAGVGALLKMIEERKKKLAAEGLFDPERKRPLPILPNVIGIVTSPTGAVIRDILHRLADRFPRHVLVWPVLVQGEGAAAQVAAAIRGFNALEAGGAVPRPDLLIVARGGGSIEDLMAFNEEIVVRAAAESAIPLISAVGHETDTTLIDFASDRRAPTPTAAAEMAVPVRAELITMLGEIGHRLTSTMNRRLGEARLAVEGLARGIPEPMRLIQEKAQSLDGWLERWANARLPYFRRREDRVAQLRAELKTPHQQLAEARNAIDLAANRLGGAFNLALERQHRGLERVGNGLNARLLTELVKAKRTSLDHIGQLLDSYSYEKVLERGFALVRDAGGSPVLSAASVSGGDALTLQFRDGTVEAVAGKGTEKPKRGKAPPPAAPQGSLL
ncbi:exodeoxyribonuclease VII large subunit [Dongia sp.]|uniref:exodeoxyribonuclease VII large subunit n=1 Tax=Dongia sp. TaxID=1977262 RepID=UPI0035B3E7EB